MSMAKRSCWITRSPKWLPSPASTTTSPTIRSTRPAGGCTTPIRCKSRASTRSKRRGLRTALAPGGQNHLARGLALREQRERAPGLGEVEHVRDVRPEPAALEPGEQLPERFLHEFRPVTAV